MLRFLQDAAGAKVPISSFFLVSNFNWPGLGPEPDRAVSSRAAPSRAGPCRLEPGGAGPSPGQLKFEFLSPTSRAIFEKDFSKELDPRHEDTMQAQRSSTSDADNRKAKRFGFR